MNEILQNGAIMTDDGRKCLAFQRRFYDRSSLMTVYTFVDTEKLLAARKVRKLAKTGLRFRSFRIRF